MKKKVLVCVGTRPNLIKITQLEKCFAAYENIEYKLLHTGQHFDYNMNDVFFSELNINLPDYQFQLQSGSQISVIAQIMEKAEGVFASYKPDLVVVPGDVNSSLACALVADRMGIDVAHIESGLRSFDRTMPEEMNRVLIDKIAKLHFVTEPSGIKHLEAEGYEKQSIKYVGNTMIDSLVFFSDKIDASDASSNFGVECGKYLLFTFHRPSNVDNRENLTKLVSLLSAASEFGKIIFPIHPRTKNNIVNFGLKESIDEIGNLILTDPLGYFDFLHLIKNSKAVVTDSGGVQEETTFLKVPCLTIRQNTERPITITEGSNTLLPFDINKILYELEAINSKSYKKGGIPDYWDGKASERIVAEIKLFFD